jgi:excisionase family DNA binding protein
MTTMETTYYTPKEVAERLKLRVQTIYDYIRKGRLPAVRLGNRCRIAQSDLDAFLRQRRGGSSASDGKSEGDAAPPIRSAHTAGGNPRTPTSPGESRASSGILQVDPEEQARKNEALLKLLNEWMADDSGYDEQVWPLVQASIEENRLSDRRRFRD